MCWYTEWDVVQGALEWLEETQDKSLEEIKEAASATPAKASGDGEDGEHAKSLVCNDCGKKFRGQAQAEFHASKSGHVDFAESTEEVTPLTEEEKKAKLQELRDKLQAKREGMSEQDKIDKKRNEVGGSLRSMTFMKLPTCHRRKSGGRVPRRPRTSRKICRRRSR